jgi:hypothetical protein
MDMRHSNACDFRLVSSYVPFVATIARAQVFIGAASFVAPLVPAHVYAALLLFAVYFDALAHAGAHSSLIGGHLLPVCLVWLSRPQTPHAARDALLAGDLLWLAVVHAVGVSYTFRRKISVGAVPILAANVALALGFLWLGAAPASALEMHVRAVAFYVFVFVHFHVFQTRAQWDVATHACLGPHVGMHLLLVDVWCAVLSVGCLAFMCVRVYLPNQDHHDTELGKPSSAPFEASVEAEDMAELLQELLAAKAVAQET